MFYPHTYKVQKNLAGLEPNSTEQTDKNTYKVLQTLQNLAQEKCLYNKPTIR
tara:strand:+ start:126 stop:281 length:156 start_codon:yes stop_codon:yes gene_type:complete